MAYANPSRYNQRHVVCPFDLFVGSLRDSFLTRFGGPGGPRTIAPVCGTVMQDQAGTAQGNWLVATHRRAVRRAGTRASPSSTIISTPARA